MILRNISGIIFFLFSCVHSQLFTDMNSTLCVFQQSDAQNLQKIKEDLQWESQWWTPQQKKETKDTKDNWKAFKTEVC